jgi:HK97 family phage major capsid protein
MDRIPFTRYSGHVSAFGAYGLPSLVGPHVTRRTLVILGFVGVLFALYAAGVIDLHAMGLGGLALGAGPVSSTTSKPLALIDEELAELGAEEQKLLGEAAKGDLDPFRSRLDEIHERSVVLEEDRERVVRIQERQRRAPAVAEEEPPQAGPTTPLGALRQRPSLAKTFIESDEWKAFKGKVAPNGYFADKTQFGASPAVAIDGGMLAPRSPQAALLTGASDTSAGAFVTNDIYAGLFDQGLYRPLTIRDIVTSGSTGSDTVEYVKLTAFTNAAAPTAEASATGDTSGTKPESSMTLAKVTETVKTIAHWIPATKRALADAGQLRTLIDAFLRYGLEEELEDQMINGDGTGENFTGISNISGVQAQAWVTDILHTTRKARTKVRTVGRARPTAYVFHPNDWETIDLLQDNEARFYGAGPFGLSPARLWGLPVVESEGATEGVGYVGDFRKCVLWDREQGSIQVSDSHSDFFVRNMVAILAELRAAFGCVQPNALVEIDLTA